MKTVVKKNLEIVEEKIQKACAESGRDRRDVTLIAVSKTKPVEQIREAYAAGIRDFGENKVQELLEKREVLPDDIRWHMIGHLQRNKVRQLVGKTVLIHSVDSLRLAEEISKEAQKQKLTVDILLELNLAGEESKFGLRDEAEIEQLIREISVLPGIRIRGLMTVAPFVENGEENREIFHKLRQLAVDIGRKNIDNVDVEILSMGMTGDYETAIREGASHVRVGTGIFGERDYSSL